jgi:hypothetical protein
MTRLRPIAILTAIMVVLALPAFVAAADLSADGTMTGAATAQAPEPGVAECTPTSSPTDPEDFICDFDTVGAFDLDEVGTGSYSGEFRLDWSIYTGAEPCAEATGTLTLTGVDGTLDLGVLDTSRVCETTDPLIHDATFDVTVLGGTGVFADATGSLTATGTLTGTGTAGAYAVALSVVGTVSVPDATPAPTVAPTVVPTDAPTVAPTEVPSASPTADLPDALPDTASGGGSATVWPALVLAIVLAASIGLLGARRRFGV